jgi:DNA mismatch endonuclease (patch repair protein)
MRANRRVDTRPEVLLRSELHRRGMRFRKDYPITVDKFRVRVDIAFTRRRFAVFVDGCFWHSCPLHGSQPKSNFDFWFRKLSGNVARDLLVSARLEQIGWTVLRVWEHEDFRTAATRIAELLRDRESGMPK